MTVQTASLRIAGVLVLAIGIGHIFMPRWGYPPTLTAEMTPRNLDHFYYLGTYAICAFLLGFGVLSLVFSTRSFVAGATVFASVMTLVWAGRFALELAFPVDVPLFVLGRPHPVLATTIALITACFAVSALAGIRRPSSDATVSSRPVRSGGS